MKSVGLRMERARFHLGNHQYEAGIVIAAVQGWEQMCGPASDSCTALPEAEGH